MISCFFSNVITITIIFIILSVSVHNHEEPSQLFSGSCSLLSIQRMPGKVRTFFAFHIEPGQHAELDNTLYSCPCLVAGKASGRCSLYEHPGPGSFSLGVGRAGFRCPSHSSWGRLCNFSKPLPPDDAHCCKPRR